MEGPCALAVSHGEHCSGACPHPGLCQCCRQELGVSKERRHTGVNQDPVSMHSSANGASTEVCALCYAKKA